MIRVMVVDDHPLVRDGICLVLSQEDDLEIVAVAASATEAVDRFTEVRPDVTLMDLRLGGRMGGLDAIRDIIALAPAARIVVLTMYQGDEDIHRALRSGAVTYLLKDTLSDDLIRVVRDVHAGEQPLSAAVQASLETRKAHPPLTPREVEVLQLVAQGKRNKEVAAILGLSEETVPVHLKHVFSKLGVNERTAAVATALRRGIIHLD